MDVDARSVWADVGRFFDILSRSRKEQERMNSTAIASPTKNKPSRHEGKTSSRSPLSKATVQVPKSCAKASRCLKAAARKHKFKLEFVNYDLGGERYKKTGEILPDSALAEFRKADAIYLGAIGHPDVKPGILEKGLLLRLRFELDQYINLRPVKLFPNVETPLANKKPEDIDFVVVRENTEGLLLLRRGRISPSRNAERSGGAGIHQHADGSGALHSLRLRTHPKTQQQRTCSPSAERPTFLPSRV